MVQHGPLVTRSNGFNCSADDREHGVDLGKYLHNSGFRDLLALQLRTPVPDGQNSLTLPRLVCKSHQQRI